MANCTCITFKDRKILEGMIKDNVSYTDMGLYFGRHRNTLKYEIEKVGKKEDYSAIVAQLLLL